VAVIVVVGATGPTGRATVRELTALGAPVRAVTRDPAGAGDLAGADVWAGDSSQPDSLAAALEGASRLFLVPPTMPAWDVAEAGIVDVARRAGVEHVVRLSALGTHPDAASMSLRFHWDGERALERSGLAFTHIRANSFFQNTLFDAPSIKRDGTMGACVGRVRFAKVDTRDIGAVVARVLTEAGHEGQGYTLTGPASLSYHDLAAIMTRVLGREVRYVDLDPAQYSRLLVSQGFPAWLADEFAAIYGSFAPGSVVEETTATVEQLLGRPPRTFEEFVADHRDEFL
jgi:uncharacterized protein YbjT (DUF2867 family)